MEAKSLLNSVHPSAEWTEFISMPVLKPSWRKRERHCTYSVILGRVRVATVASKKPYIIIIIIILLLNMASESLFSCLTYPVCKLHAAYYTNTCVRFGSTTFSTLSNKKMVRCSEKFFEYKMRVLTFSTALVWSTSHLEKNSVSYCHKCLHVMCRLFLSDFYGTWIFSTYFRKIHKYKISLNSSSGSRVVSMRTGGRTDGQTWRS
jgi:hypothetical protein